MQNILNEILLSENVVEKFYKYYDKAQFKNWITSILPELEDCRNTEQNNPWHIYNVLEHILHSVEEINKLTKTLKEDESRMLAYTMFLHDIGKPLCKTRRYSALYKREVDSFFEHNKVSKKIADRVLNSFGFSIKEQNIIKTLIEEHDWFMFVVLKDDGNKYHKVLTNSLLKEQIANLNKTYNGIKMMEYLTRVGIADNMAQNPSLTKESLEKINIIKNMLKNIKENTKD